MHQKLYENYLKFLHGFIVALSVQNLQTEQLTKIRDLERQVSEMRSHHTQAIQQLKSDFLRQKREFQTDSDTRIQSLEKKANKVIMHHVFCHCIASWSKKKLEYVHFIAVICTHDHLCPSKHSEDDSILEGLKALHIHY